MVKKTSTVAVTGFASRPIEGCGGDEPGRLVEETEKQGGGHIRITGNVDAFGLGAGEAVFEEGQAGLGVELATGGHAENRGSVGQDAGDRGVGGGVHVGPAAEVELVPHGVSLGGGTDDSGDELVLELGHDGCGDGGLRLEVVIERAPGDAGALGYLVPAGRSEALVGEELPRCRDEGRPGRC